MVMVHLQCQPDQRQAILHDLLRRDGLCDCSLVSGGQVFPTHRLVLGAISPLCLNLLREAEGRGDVREDNGRVELHLPDFSPQALEEFLQIIYGLQRDSIGEAGPLLAFLGVDPSADSFQLLPQLKPDDTIREQPSLIPVSKSSQRGLVTRRRSQRSRTVRKVQKLEDSDEDWMPELEGGYPLTFDDQLLSAVEDEKQHHQSMDDEEINVKKEEEGCKLESSESTLWSLEECRSMLTTVGNQLQIDWSKPIDLTNARSQLMQIKRDTSYRALLGLRSSAIGLEGKLLAFSDPQSPEDMEAQFEDTSMAMKDVAGFSNGDVFFQTSFYTRQNLSIPKTLKELKDSLKGKMEKLTIDQLNHIMSSEKMLPVMARTEARGLRDLKETPSHFITICSNITSLEMEEVILVCFPHQSKTLHFKQMIVNPERIADCAKIWVDVLLDVWCTNRSSLTRASFLLDRFQSVTEPMTVYSAAKSVLDSRQVVCSDCGEVFSMVTAKKREAWNRHQEMHKLQKFECDCNVNLTTNVEKENHVKLFHCNGKYLKCEDCEFIGSEKELSEHRNFNHQTYVCDICGTVSMNLKRHNGHLLTHKVSKCDVCGEEFQGPSKLFRHKSNVHGKDFSCEDCGHVFKGRLKWMLHKKRAHEEGARFICDLCGQSFNRKLTMKRHKISVHIKNRPFVCRYGCGADYNDECNLRTHEKRRHGGVFKQGSFLYIYKNI